MSKQQIALLSGALILFIALSFLPKSVVDNEKGTVGEVLELQKEIVEETHLEISETDKSKLDSLQAEFAKSENSEKEVLFSDIISLYVANNRIDSAARFAEANLAKNANWEEKKKVGDLYFNAFTFSFDNTEANRWAKKVGEYYEDLLKTRPDSLNLRVKVGLTLVSSQTPMQGILMIRGVLDKDIDNQLAIKSLGMLSIQSKQYDKAIGRFERLIELNPNDLEAQYYLGVSQHELGKEAEAMATFEKLRKSTSDANILQAVDGYLGEEHKEH
ncbi:MAG: tetratricopeptide (TPR) repeat protein [Flammeovirgaceae bacterium]|jgi:tetratricopeptide (TPR) repeat protein